MLRKAWNRAAGRSAYGIRSAAVGPGIMWNIIRYETPVIPAKAGIHSVDNAFPKVRGVDSRFRGNDCGLERPCLANDTATLRFTRACVGVIPRR